MVFEPAKLAAAATCASLLACCANAATVNASIVAQSETSLTQMASGSLLPLSGVLTAQADTNGFDRDAREVERQEKQTADLSLFERFDAAFGTLNSIDITYIARSTTARSGLTSSVMAYTNLYPFADEYRRMDITTQATVGYYFLDGSGRTTRFLDLVTNERGYTVDGGQTVLEQRGQGARTRVNDSETISLAAPLYLGLFSGVGQISIFPFLEVFAENDLYCDAGGGNDLTRCEGQGSYSAENEWEISVTYNFTPVPDEPAPIPLPAGLPFLVVALGGLAALRRWT